MTVAESDREGVSLRSHDTERTGLPMLYDSTLPLRFWRKVYADPFGCWLWRGAINNDGYGTFTVDGRTQRAHRVLWESIHGSIPEGLTTDHICRIRACVNPAHIELVSAKVNTLRGIGPTSLNAQKTHCSKGHLFDLLNTLITTKGRVCRACKREINRRYQLRPEIRQVIRARMRQWRGAK